MTARRIVIYALLSIAALLIVLFVITPLPAHAQTATAADELLLPIVVHANGTPSWGTETVVYNHSADDTVSISFTFMPANASDSDPSTPLPEYYPNRKRIGPHGILTLSDEDLGKIIGQNRQGMLILDACLDGESCLPVLLPGPFRNLTRFTLFHLTRPFRNISAEVHAYAYVPNPAGLIPPLATRGDSYLAIPYWATSRLSDGPVDIPWIESDAKHSTTIGLVNASSYSAITLRTTLFDGLGVKRGERDEMLCALCNVRRTAESMFPALAATNRANRQPAGAGWWVRVEQIGSEPNEWAAKEKAVADVESCVGGCAQFIAYASVMDSSFVMTPCPLKQACVPDVHFIMPQSEMAGVAPTFETVNQSSEVAAALGRTSGFTQAAKAALDSVALPSRPATSEVALPPCAVVVRPDNLLLTDALGRTVSAPNIRVEDAQGRTVFLLTREELMRMPPQICGPPHVETVARRAGGAQ